MDGWKKVLPQLMATTGWQTPVGRLSKHTRPLHPPGGGQQLMGAPLPANLVAHLQLERRAHFLRWNAGNPVPFP